MDAMKFFQQSAGKWRSQRTTHHLPFRRAETGESEIHVEALSASDSKVIEICELHNVDPKLAVGGAFVSWHATMAWDKEDENHEGTTVFALVPDPDNPKKGRLLRERGYAEITPVVGRYEIDEDEALLLTTDYETMETTERFWFAGTNLRFRSSTVSRFGGLSTATFCAETRLELEETPSDSDLASSSVAADFILGW